MLEEESTAPQSGTKRIEQLFWSSQDCEPSQEAWESSRLPGLCCVPGVGPRSLRMTKAPEPTAGRVAPGQEQKGAQGN